MCHAGAMPAATPGPAPRAVPALPISVPKALARTLAEQAALCEAAEAIWARACAAGGDLARPVVLRLRRETDAAGHRLWAVHEERDVWLPYASIPRRFCELRPSRRAEALLEYVARLMAESVRARRPAGGEGNVVRLRA